MIIVRLPLRFLLVPIGASVATCVAMVVIIVAHWSRFVALAGSNPAPGDDPAFVMLLLGPALVMTAAAMGMLAPAAIGVLIAEGFAIRSWIYHVANGGLSAALGWIALQDVRRPYEIFNEPLIVVGAGIAAGFAYWAVAGWNAGFWKPVFNEPATENRLSEERR